MLLDICFPVTIKGLILARSRRNANRPDPNHHLNEASQTETQTLIKSDKHDNVSSEICDMYYLRPKYCVPGIIKKFMGESPNVLLVLY